MKVFIKLKKLQNFKHTKHCFFQKRFITSIKFTKIDYYENGNNGDNQNGYDLVTRIRECTNLGLYNHGEQLHCYVLTTGFITNVFVSSALINFYVKLDLLKYAHKLFDEIPEPGLVAWNSLISGYVRFGMFRMAITLFLRLERSGLCSDSYSFTSVLAICGQISLVQLGKSVHCRILKFGVECSTFVANCLIDMYGKCERFEDAIKIFDEMHFKDTFSWNSVIAASTRNQKIDEAFGYLTQMPIPDTISYNEIISGFARFGKMEHALEILSKMPNPNSSSWNSILTGYVNRNLPRNAFEFFGKMHLNDVQMDEFTFSSILSGIASLGAVSWGNSVNCCVIKRGFDESVVIGSSLIDMYCKSGEIKSAEFLFESLPEKNLVTWNAMISGFAHNANSTKVIEVFERLKNTKNLQPDGITFLNVLSACWHNKTSLETANGYFESMINDYEIDPTVEHCSCMIRIMGREGDLLGANEMIKRLGFESCGAVWRALLAACGVCGELEVAEIAGKKVIEIEGDGEFVYVMMSNIYARFGMWEDVRAMRKKMRDNEVIKAAGFSWIE